MKAIAKIAIVFLVVGAAFIVGVLVGRTSSNDIETDDTPSILTLNDQRPIVFVEDGGTDSIDDWGVTASFLETTAPYGYGKRRVDFNVRVDWTGEDSAGELMGYTFLENAMGLVSPSGRVASVHLRGDFSAGFEGIAYNGSTPLPDEEGTFYLIFAPHPNKHGLVWSVDLPYLP